MDIEVLPPNINESLKNITVVPGQQKIRFGLLAIKNVGIGIIDATTEEIKKGGPFTSISDFVAPQPKRRAEMRSARPYFKILATTPAPTVRPPSRIAKRKPSSIAIGAISSISLRCCHPASPSRCPRAGAPCRSRRSCGNRIAAGSCQKTAYAARLPPWSGCRPRTESACAA